MKVLLIHNYYAQRGGEDVVFERELRLLKNNNIEVVTYTKSNIEYSKFIDKVKISTVMIWSQNTYTELVNLIVKEKPDVAHFHNIWYNISPSAYYACKELKVPVVQTLHNFRIFCANGLLFRNNRICEKCINHIPFYGIYYGCYRNSRIHTIPISFTEHIHKLLGTWENKIDAYIALTEFSKNIFVRYGLNENKIFVKPNFVYDTEDSGNCNYDYFLYVGRLSNEKGLMFLLEAYKIFSERVNKFPLKIVGEGPLYNDIKDFIDRFSINNIELVGKLDEKSVSTIMRDSLLLIIPSISYEMFPLVIVEAYKNMKAVIAPTMGSFCNIVKDLETGLLFQYGSLEDLVYKMEWAINNKDKIRNMGINARKYYLEKYNAENNFDYLINIYKKIIYR